MASLGDICLKNLKKTKLTIYHLIHHTIVLNHWFKIFMKCLASSGCGDRFSGNRTAEFGSLVDEVGEYVHKNPS